MKLPIPNYSRYYLNTEDNRVYNSKDRPISEYISCKPNGSHPVSKLNIVDDNGFSKNVMKHRLVYMAYHPDEDISDLQINHLDENSLNNDISNLKPCTGKENMNWGTVGHRISLANKGRLNNHRSKPVIAYVLDDYAVEHYPSINEAARVINGDRRWIIDCCKGYRVDYAGRIWQYERR